MEFSYAATDSVNTVLHSQSVLTEQPEDFNYGPWGGLDKSVAITPGFNGDRCDPVTGVTHLGNGYRAYNPVLRRFQAPDSWSPFGDGGINHSAYCEGDPVNRSDPSGHTSWQVGVGIGLSIIGVGLSVVGGYAAVSAAKGVKAVAKAATITVATALPGIAGVATGVASTQVEDPETAEQLAWASLGLGVVSLIAGGGMVKYGGEMKASSIDRANHDIARPERGPSIELHSMNTQRTRNNAGTSNHPNVPPKRRQVSYVAPNTRQINRETGKVGKYEFYQDPLNDALSGLRFIEEKPQPTDLTGIPKSNRINPTKRSKDPARHWY